MKSVWRALIAFGLEGAMISSVALAYDPGSASDAGRNMLAHQTPQELQDVGITEHLGDQLDGSLQFVDDSGAAVTLGQFFDGTKPVLLSMVYYTCPSLCNYHLNGLNETYKQMKLSAGQDFRVVAVSMNHREGPDVAGKKKANYLKDYGRDGAASGWHFLTGTEANVRRLADQLGFRFKWVEASQEYAHASAAFIVTPGGQISRYLYGIEFQPKDLRLALLEASDGKIGSLVDQLILFCFQFDPAKNKYTLYAWNVMRLGALLSVLALAVLLIPIWLRERRMAT